MGQGDELLRHKSNVKSEDNLCYVYLHIFQMLYLVISVQYRDLK